MKKFLVFIFILLFSVVSFAQDCFIISKANSIVPDKLCSPVSVEWTISYNGVFNPGDNVQIQYEWDDGGIEIVDATETSPDVFETVANHTYTSTGNICNYHPLATLIINGVTCTSSSQEQIVTVWDDDDHNGGRMNIDPDVYPICFGNSGETRFRDNTQFNCVPPQERDNPNVQTRWVQWIYGTDITMTGTPVRVNGLPRIFPYSGPVITLPGPVTGSGIMSDLISVDNDKLLGEYWEITLRNWNYCNPYDDPDIPGLPLDPVNGDHPPVVTTAIILIVGYPDATITPVDEMCLNAPLVVLESVDPGGVWNGNGIVGDVFDPMLAGVGNHVISYNIINGNGCTDYDETTITVAPIPNATILSPGTVCLDDPPFPLIAGDNTGTWSGPGVVGNIFDPMIAGDGDHLVTYYVADVGGCDNTSNTIIRVITPDATITQVDTLCVDDPPIGLIGAEPGGIWSGNGVVDNLFYPNIAGPGIHRVDYILNTENCIDADSIYITVMPLPIINIEQVDTLYITDPSVLLTATPSGGIWSGIGVTGNIFNPLVAGVGTHLITYKILPMSWGCSVIDSIYITVIYPPLPVASFDCFPVGCAPLKIDFDNNSLYEELYEWDFGDGFYSYEKEPSHTYLVPGDYIVRLRVSNISGSDTYESVITAYQNPVAAFTVYPTEVINHNQVVRVSDFSQYVDFYTWDFGDGTTYNTESPYHQYELPGTYTISLFVETVNGCLDSTEYDTEIVVDFNAGRILFPNAFRWNGSGPTGGWWTDGSIDNTIFRPHLENVVEYNLIIYTRWGEKLFESNDYYKGWDGYYQEQLVSQGVYVYRARGKYTNGEYFDISGDVTFLH